MVKECKKIKPKYFVKEPYQFRLSLRDSILEDWSKIQNFQVVFILSTNSNTQYTFSVNTGDISIGDFITILNIPANKILVGGVYKVFARITIDNKTEAVSLNPSTVRFEKL